MKANCVVKCGKIPEVPKSTSKIIAKIDAKDGQIAHDKFKAITGEDFSAGAVILLPTSNPVLLLKHLKLDSIAEIKPSFIDLKTLACPDGVYLYLNAKLEELPIPPKLLELSMNTPISLEVDFKSCKSTAEVLNFIKEEPSLTPDIVFSRLISSVYSGFIMTTKLDVPPESIDEIYSQIKDLIPIPLPVDPTIGARILENLEYELDMDSYEDLPKTFKNDYWDKNAAEYIKKLYRFYITVLEKLFGQTNEEILKEIGETMTSDNYELHLFAKNWGHITLAYNSPGALEFVNEIKNFLQMCNI